MLTGVHYSLPRSRRWGLWLCLASHMQRYAGGTTVNSRKAIAVVFMEEVVGQAAKYPSLKIPADVEANEEAVALFFKDKIERTGWTRAEDKMIREALKVHAGVNEFGVMKTGRVALASGQFVALDPEQDKPLREKRDAWLKEKMGR